MEVRSKVAIIILLVCLGVASVSMYILLDIVASKNYTCVAESTIFPHVNFPKEYFIPDSEKYISKKTIEPMCCLSIPQALKHKMWALFLAVITWISSVIAAHLLNYFTDWGINKIKTK
jgi:hypothetical protein